MSTWFGFPHMGLRIVVALGTLAGAALVAQERYVVIPRGVAIQPGPEGTALVLKQATEVVPGCTGVGYGIVRVDLRTGIETKAACLPLPLPAGFGVASDGGVVALGAPASRPADVTPGALDLVPPGTVPVLQVMRFRPDGGVAWAAQFGSGGAGGTLWEDARIVTAADGSLVGAASVIRPDLPTTANAVQHRGNSEGSVYLFRLSADGRTLLYATYLSSKESWMGVSDLVADAEGSVFLAGFARDGAEGLPVTPGSFTDQSPLGGHAFVARFDMAASQMRYLVAFGVDAIGPKLAAGTGGRVAVAGISGVKLPGTPAALQPELPPYGGYLFELATDGMRAEFSTGLGGSADIAGLVRDSEGNIILSGRVRLALPTTANAWEWAGRDGYVMKVRRDGRRLAYSVGVACSLCQAAVVGDVLALTSGFAATFRPAAPVTRDAVADPDQRVLFVAVAPPGVRECGGAGLRTLRWDVRDPAATVVEVRRGSIGGDVVARGLSGTALAGTGVYLLRDVSGGPFGTPRTLASLEVKPFEPPAGCLAPPSLPPQFTPYMFSVSPNPVLSCREAALSGTEVTVSGSGPHEVMLRVLDENGPVLAADRSWQVRTGDWVRNGMKFLMMGSDILGVGSNVFAWERVYLLPNRSCTSDAPNLPMIRATRDCDVPSRFTLAWWSGEAVTQIREESVDGPVVITSEWGSGLPEVTVSRRTEYWLMTWLDGMWVPLGSAVADPAAVCEDGR